MKVELEGPWSPLELKFTPVCHSSRSKPVVIDSNSVNSVCLDLEPSAPTSRLLIASSVVIQDKSGHVCARSVYCIRIVNCQIINRQMIKFMTCY